MSPRCEKHGKHAGICWDCADEAGKGPPWLADAAEALGEAARAKGLGDYTAALAIIRELCSAIERHSITRCRLTTNGVNSP